MTEDRETDPGFPSGPWAGFYAYAGYAHELHRMRLDLSFSRSHVRGGGDDDVGPFRIHGNYEVDSRRCWWVKTYPGSHEVYYRGTQQGRMIRGEWALPPYHMGTFAIWPGGEAGLEEEFFLVEEQGVEEEATARLVVGSWVVGPGGS